jgi:glycosyltransferase involved in cell wall biosynthesis
MISIISPVFNSARFIEGCLKSVADQREEGIEHWVIDAGSQDGSVEIIARFAEQHPHVKWISEKDSGQSEAMNKGIALASNPVISFLNADDRYEPGTFRRVKEIFEGAAEPLFLVGNCRVLMEDGSLYMINKPQPFDPVSFMLEYSFPYNPSAYFYHKSIHRLIGNYDESDHLTMDIDFLFRMIKVARIRYEDEDFGNYVMVSDSKTMQEISAGRNVENLQRVFEKYENRLGFFQKLNLSFQRKLGKHRGWVMYYLRNPRALPVRLFGQGKEKFSDASH